MEINRGESEDDSEDSDAGLVPILVVDDNTINMAQLIALLKDFNFNAQVANDGNDAISFVRRRWQKN